MPQTRKNHSPGLKAKVAVAAIKSHKTAAQIAQMFGVHPTQVGSWKETGLGWFARFFRQWPRAHPKERVFFWMTALPSNSPDLSLLLPEWMLFALLQMTLSLSENPNLLRTSFKGSGHQDGRFFVQTMGPPHSVLPYADPL